MPANLDSVTSFVPARTVIALLILPIVLSACATGGGPARGMHGDMAAYGAEHHAERHGPRKEVLTPGGPLFSTVIRSGNVLYLSGVIGRSPDGDAAAATRQALEGVRQRLERVDHSMADVIKCTVYLIDMDDYGAMNEVYREFFPTDPPARTAVAVRALPVNAQVEVDCIAAAR